MRSWNSRFRSSTASVRSPNSWPSTSARCSGLPMTTARSSRATAAGAKMLPHSTSIVTLPRYGSSARAAARTSSSKSATSTRRRGGGVAASTRRAMAWPTRPLPPSSMIVRSASSMQSLDCSDFLPGELPPLALGELAEPHGAVGDAVQPFDFEIQRFCDASDDPLPPFGQRQLDLHRLALLPHARLDDTHGAPIDDDPLRERATNRGRIGAVHAQPVGARHLVAW